MHNIVISGDLLNELLLKFSIVEIKLSVIQSSLAKFKSLKAIKKTHPLSAMNFKNIANEGPRYTPEV